MHTLLSEFVTAIQNGEPQSAHRFWEQVRKTGTPLIEPSPGQPGHHRVTFLWRDEKDNTREVLVNIRTVTATQRRKGNLSDYLMEHIPNTDIWQLSLDLPSEFLGTYRLFILDDQFPELRRDNIDESTFNDVILKKAVFDSLNPHTFRLMPAEEPASVIRLPKAPQENWWIQSPGTPAGELIEFSFASTALADTRSVWCYTPPGYSANSDAYPVMVLLDGDMWSQGLGIRWILDNLIAANLIPPMVVILPESLPWPGRLYEYACNDAFLEFVLTELMPWAHSRWNITQNLHQSIIAGWSAGGLAAAFVALRAPHRFGNVLSQSGGFGWPYSSGFLINPQYFLAQELARLPYQPIRFYLEAGSHEPIPKTENDKMHAALKDHGYSVIYHEYCGGHDTICARANIGQALIRLTQDWHTTK